MRTAALPLGLFVLALALRTVLMIGWSFDGLYGQDAFAYFNCAREITRLHAWQVPCLNFYWPLGYPALAALLMKVMGDSGAQWAALLSGAALAPLACGIAGLSAPPGSDPAAVRRAALAAGLLAACAAQPALSSLVVMSDVPGLFWASLAVFFALGYARYPSRKACLPALAVALGAALASRWVFAALALPVVVYLAFQMRRTNVPYPSLAFSALLFGLIAAVLVYQNVHSPGEVTHHAWVLNWNLGSAWQMSFDNPDGHFSYRAPPALFYAAPLYHPAFLPVVLLPFALIGAWRVRHTAAGRLLIVWAASMYCYFIGVPYENLRFPLAYLMPCLVFAGLGLFLAPGTPALGWRFAVLTASLVISLSFAVRGAHRLRAEVTRQGAAIAYLRAHAPSDATVVSFGLSISLEHYTAFPIIDLYGATPAALRSKICGHPALLFVDRANLRSQWQGHGPEALVEWLESAVGTEPIGAQDNWQLYRVGDCAASPSAVPPASASPEPRSRALPDRPA